MKRSIALLIVCVLIVLLCSCGDGSSAKQSTIDGMYEIESVLYEDYYLSPDESISTSYVSVTQSGKNLFATVYLSIEDEFGMLVGHLSEHSKTDESIQYKLWIDSTVGDLVNSTDWIYIYYYPNSDSVEINVSGDMCFEFVK